MILPLIGSAASLAFLTSSNAWKYNDESVDLGTAWLAPGYDDSAWSNGLPALGFRALGSTNYLLPFPNYIRTVPRKNTPTNAARNILTFYFRTHFTFTNKPGDVTLTASNLIDDGAVFYMNGRELTRVAMPIGPVDWSTLATRADDVGTNAVGGVNTHGYDVFSVPVDAVVQGDNVVAVEVHQASSGSSDMVFQMELWADFPVPTQLTITSEPQDVAVEETKTASLRVGVSGGGPHYHWYRQGVGQIPGAVVDTYTLAVASTNDSGLYYAVVTNLVNSVTSRVVRLTVFGDINAPTLVDADGSPSLTNVLVSFSELVQPLSATNLANYKITNTLGGTLTVTNAVLLNGTNVMLTTTSGRLANNNYILIVNRVRDLSPRQNIIVTNSMIPVSNLATLIALDDGGWRYYDPYPPFDPPNLGTAWREVNYVETNVWGTGTSVFYDGPNANGVPGPINSALSQTPTFTSYFRNTLSGLQFGSGKQKFFLTHIIDDGAVFYLNGAEFFRTNMSASPVNYLTPASTSVGSILRLGPIPFTNSFLSGTNVFAVELHQASNTDVDKAFGLRVDAYIRSVFVGPVIVTAGPANLTVLEGQPATFEVVHVGGNTFQWQQSNVNIPGAIDDAYTIPAVSLAMNGLQFRVTVAGSGSVTTTNATLRVIAESNAPTLVTATANLNAIVVSFSESLRATTANLAANYRVTNLAGLNFAVTGASLSSGTNVLLSFASLPAGGFYFVVVNNVKDASVAGNTIASNSTVRAGFQVGVVGFADAWKYDQSASNLTAQGWTARTYNDNAWSGSGPGLLDGKAGGRTAATLPLPVGTVLLAPTNGPGGRYLNTVYFRRHFNFSASGPGTLTYQTVLDDAAVIYLNGVEINRLRMNAGAVDFNTQAASSVADATLEGPFTLLVSNLLAGDNVIAVEVHQSGTTSSDVTWGGDFSVSIPSAVLPPAQPGPACTSISWLAPLLLSQRSSGTNVLLSWTNPVTNTCGNGALFTLQQALTFTNPVSSTAWSNVTTVSPYLAVGTNKSRFFRLRQ